MIVALDGVGKITIEGEEFILNEGETIVMPAKNLMLFCKGTIQNASYRYVP